MRVTRWATCGIVCVVLAASCSSSSDDSSAEPTPEPGPADEAVYAAPGPYTVGLTTVRMDDRDVEVWYPADADAADGELKATYDQTTALPTELESLVPEEFNSVVTMDASRDIAPSAEGPFPVVIYSHGAGAHRMASSALTVGLASWGFVVVSADYVERGVATQLPGQTPLTLDPERDRAFMLASLDRISEENADSESLLYGIADESRIATVGHSAGGMNALDALTDPRVTVAVGWAPGPPSGTPADKPTMIIGASNDTTIVPTILDDVYEAMPGEKRLVRITDAGHSSFTDLCVMSEGGSGLVSYAIESGAMSEEVGALVMNGCEETSLADEMFWPVVQHFTVAQLRDAFGIDAEPVGLGDAVANDFPGVEVSYDADP